MLDPLIMRNQTGHYAGFFSRLFAFMLDAGVVALLSFLALAGTRLLLSTFGLDCVTDLLVRSCEQQPLPRLVLPLATLLEEAAPFIAALFTPVLVFFYIIFFWALTGQTPGKAQMGVRIVRMNGDLMNWRVALLRLIGYGISIVALFLGFAWILIDDQRRGWHDRMAGTCVVYSWAAQPDERFLMGALQALRRGEPQS